MLKVAVILLAAADTPEGMGRMANALTTVRAARRRRRGPPALRRPGVTCNPSLVDPEQEYAKLFDGLRPVAAACLYCARAYGVKDAVETAGVPFADEFKDHPSMRGLLADGFDVITF